MRGDTVDTTQAVAALTAYAGADDVRDDVEQIVDLVTELLHLARSRGVDPAEILRQADRHATAEGVFSDYVEAESSAARP